MLIIPSTSFSVAVKLDHLKLSVKKTFAERLKKAVGQSTHHPLNAELLPEDILRVGPFPSHDWDFILGVITGIDAAMGTNISIDRIYFSIDHGKK